MWFFFVLLIPKTLPTWILSDAQIFENLIVPTKNTNIYPLHVVSVHENKKEFQCSICLKQLARNSYMKEHFAKCHKGEDCQVIYLGIDSFTSTSTYFSDGGTSQNRGRGWKLWNLRCILTFAGLIFIYRKIDSCS